MCMHNNENHQINEDQIIDHNKESLQNYCNTRYKNYKYKGKQDIFKQTIYNFDQVFKNQHNCQAYFITVTFPIEKNNRNIAREWTQAGQFIENFKILICKNYLVVGGIIALEPHKNTSLKSTRGKNTKAGSPHFHMVLWLCHQFINPHLDNMGYDLLEYGSFSKISLLSNRMDVLKAAVYATKEKGNKTVNYLCNAFTKWKNNINIWSNHHETDHLFKKIENSLNQNFKEHDNCFKSNEFYNIFPTTRYYPDKALLLAELFNKVFAKQGLAVRQNNVYKRIPGTKFSWEKWCNLDFWITKRFDFNAPTAYLQMLKDNTLWISKQGATTKNQKPFDIFPKLTYAGFLVEFNDCVYQFFNGNTLPFEYVPPITASLCHVDQNFDQCTPPFTLVGLLHTLIAWGKDIAQEREQLLAIPANQLQKEHLGTLQHQQNSEDRFNKALRTFGGMYHPHDNRKQNPALYLRGEPSTYKTFILQTIFKRLVGLDSVDIISRHSGRFNTGKLRKDENEPYILIIDDMRWDCVGMNNADLINLLDGYFVNTEKKYIEAQSGELKGTIAITSNEPVGGPSDTNLIPVIDKMALHTRLNDIQFHQIREEFVVNEEFIEQIHKEAVGFSILTNAIYLAQNRHAKTQLKVPKSFFNQDVESNASMFQKAGHYHMKQILKSFQ